MLALLRNATELCWCLFVQDHCASVQECVFFINRKIGLATKRGNCSRVYKSHATNHNNSIYCFDLSHPKYDGHLFNTHFLSSYYGSGTVLGDIMMVSPLKKLHLHISGVEHFWLRTQVHIMWLSASVFTQSCWYQSHQFGELEQLTVTLLFAKSTFLA